jgi:hypothetical protein
MLPYKHYAASEIEQVLLEQEDPTAPPHECPAEESTLYRWRRTFPEVLSGLTTRLSVRFGLTVSLVRIGGPLQRLYGVLEGLARLPSEASRLAWAFFLSQSHPVHIG